MAVLKRQNVCFGTKYTDNAGQEKTRWVTVGKAFHSDRGGISIKFDTIPAGGWDGWVQLFDERDPNQAPQGYSRQGAGPTGYGQQGPAGVRRPTLPGSRPSSLRQSGDRCPGG